MPASYHSRISSQLPEPSKPATFNPKFLEKFDVEPGEKLGSGGFGFVIKCFQIESRQHVAVKFIEKSKINDDEWIKTAERGRIPLEVFYLTRINLKNVIRFIDYYEDPDFVYLVFDSAD
jgi:serine/threonine protein kinase